MALSFNGTTLATNIDAVVFNGTPVSKVMFNGNEVWAKAPDITFIAAESAYRCSSFSVSGNTFTIGGGALIAYSKSTGFTGSTGALGGQCGGTLSTSSGRIYVSGASTYVDMEYLSDVPYFRGVSMARISECNRGLISGRNTNPSFKTSTLHGDGCNGNYVTNQVKILR